MKAYLLVLISVQLSLMGLAVAQITFTREWVTGKRSSAPKVQVLMHEEDTSFCKSLIPAIDYLLEAEKIREKVCGPPTKAVPYAFLWGKPMHANEAGGSENTEQVMQDVAPYQSPSSIPVRKSI